MKSKILSLFIVLLFSLPCICYSQATGSIEFGRSLHILHQGSEKACTAESGICNITGDQEEIEGRVLATFSVDIHNNILINFLTQDFIDAYDDRPQFLQLDLNSFFPPNNPFMLNNAVVLPQQLSNPIIAILQHQGGQGGNTVTINSPGNPMPMQVLASEDQQNITLTIPPAAYIVTLVAANSQSEHPCRRKYCPLLWPF